MSYDWNFPEFDNKDSQIQGRAAVLFILLLFSIVFLFTYLFLYVRWLFRPFPPHPSHAPPPGGLNSDKINTIPIVLYEESGEK
ncbi:hypothetical protein ACJIZ3_022354 [Penstemon smallii]|uniref:Uncharacterized protein n=1 Tax=Penstemon smallii TaxID=265156 RepID=A0ABD3TN58_9LAMI